MYKIKLVNGSCYDVNIDMLDRLLKNVECNFYEINKGILINPKYIVEIIPIEQKESFEEQMARNKQQMSNKNPVLELKLTEEEKKNFDKAIRESLGNIKSQLSFKVPKINIPELKK